MMPDPRQELLDELRNATERYWVLVELGLGDTDESVYYGCFLDEAKMVAKSVSAQRAELVQVMRDRDFQVLVEYKAGNVVSEFIDSLKEKP